MRRAIKGGVFFLLAALIFLSGCNFPGIKDTARMGRMEGRTYVNDYFGLSFNIPENWTIASKQEKEQLINSANKTIAGNDEDVRNQLDNAIAGVLYLVLTSKYPFGHTGSNPNLQCYAEKLGAADSLSIKSGRDYLNISMEQMKQSNLPCSFSSMASETLGGKHFDVQKVKMNANGTTVTQKFYCAIINGYAVNFVITYTSTSELNELNNILKTVKFK